MSATVPQAPIAPLFISVTDFKKYGLPGRTLAYKQAALGLLDLVKVNGRCGVTYAEANRYVAAMARPFNEAKVDTARGTAASVAARRARA